MSCPHCKSMLEFNENAIEVACRSCKQTVKVVNEGNSIYLEAIQPGSKFGIRGEIKRLENQIEDIIDSYDGPILTFAVITIICGFFAVANPPGSVHSSFGFFCIAIGSLTGVRCFAEWHKRRKKLNPLKERLNKIQ